MSAAREEEPASPAEHAYGFDVERELQWQFPQLPPATVRAVVQQCEAELAGARVRAFVPVLVRRLARRRLRLLSLRETIDTDSESSGRHQTSEG